jgi:hypothetical protein
MRDEERKGNLEAAGARKEINNLEAEKFKPRV